MIRRIRRARCAPPPMMHFVFSRSVPSNLTLGTFLGCIPQRSSAAVSQGALCVLLRRRYDAPGLHIECLLLQVNDVPPLTDTSLRTVCKHHRQPTARWRLQKQRHVALKMLGLPANVFPLFAKRKPESKVCLQTCGHSTNVKTFPRSCRTLKLIESISLMSKFAALFCANRYRVFIPEHVAVHSKKFIDIPCRLSRRCPR